MKTIHEKQVCYVYPSSPDALRFGLKNGGYVVRASIDEHHLFVSLAGYETRASAYDLANTLEGTFSKYDLSEYENKGTK